MRCPLCNEVVEDKDTLYVHYTRSCTGHRRPAARALDLAAADARDVPITAARKATVTFLWEKSVPTMERKIYLFGTFDQVFHIVINWCFSGFREYIASGMISYHFQILCTLHVTTNTSVTNDRMTSMALLFVHRGLADSRQHCGWCG
ncbi:uncharacterized protein LOC134186450 [Corticium candelabrum]|uniref:uncharacterized protein LOC134186450 n=1 Tax=Corticium candelabrum TaxID=121492 RepID=UPI002E271BBF|nr:uncharacterized protein LOC134186450 [Corticium candelabrum]